VAFYRTFGANLGNEKEFLAGATVWRSLERKLVKTDGKKKAPKAPWRCPKCGREFATKLAFHSCGNYTLEGYLEGKNPEGIALFQRLIELAKSMGPIQVSPVKTQVSFRLRTTFMMAFVAGRRIGGYLFLSKPSPSPCFRKIASASANRHVHVFQVSDAQTLQSELAQHLREAINYAGDKEKDTVDAVEKGAARIGDEINALYREERARMR
jgi:hypothetical protein